VVLICGTLTVYHVGWAFRRVWYGIAGLLLSVRFSRSGLRRDGIVSEMKTNS
jgi:hypothetical protein